MFKVRIAQRFLAALASVLKESRVIRCEIDVIEN